MNPAHYSYRVLWSAEDEEYVATVVEFPSLSWLAASPVDALRGLEALVHDVVTNLNGPVEQRPSSPDLHSG